jgi:hypothetical protein
MNLRAYGRPAGAGIANALTIACGLAQRTQSNWLACYPVFHDVLQREAGTFGELSPHVTQRVITRVAPSIGEQAFAISFLADIGASFVRAPTPLVEKAVERYFSMSKHAMRSLDDFAAQIPNLCATPDGQQPCIVQPGQGVFLEGWVRFLSYRARGDSTIPLLALDWPELHKRLALVSESAIAR